MYTKHATRKTNKWWKCVKRSSIGCTWAKIWLGLSLVLVARSFMAFLVFEYLMLVSLGAIIPSNRGGSKLCYQGYLYTKHATRETNQWWKCVKRSSIGWFPFIQKVKETIHFALN
jgi:hypothetical protein